MSTQGLAGMSARFLLCYAYGHRWLFDTSWSQNGGLITERFRCTCGTYKYETWTHRTRVSWGRAIYAWPKGYRLGYRVTREVAKQEIRARGMGFWTGRRD